MRSALAAGMLAHSLKNIALSANAGRHMLDARERGREEHLNNRMTQAAVSIAQRGKAAKAKGVEAEGQLSSAAQRNHFGARFACAACVLPVTSYAYFAIWHGGALTCQHLSRVQAARRQQRKGRATFATSVRSRDAAGRKLETPPTRGGLKAKKAKEGIWWRDLAHRGSRGDDGRRKER